MRSKLLGIFLLLSSLAFGQVPNTDSFTLDTVIKVVEPATNDLSACFAAATKAYFDPLYDSIGYAPVNSLLRFRNYTPVVGGCVIHGYLYNWYATQGDSIANTGWSVPDTTQWGVLRNYLINNGYGYEGSGTDISKSLASVYNWYPGAVAGTPGNDTLSNNSSKFNAQTTGERTYYIDTWVELEKFAKYWTYGTYSTYGQHVAIYDSGQIYGAILVFTYYSKKNGHGIRLIKDSTTKTHGQTGTYTGNDGKTYTTICIGTQEWMSENLAETKYIMGSTIPTVTTWATWAGLTTGAKCAYNNDQSNVGCDE